MTTKKIHRNKKNITKKFTRYIPFEKKITKKLNNKQDKVIEINNYKKLKFEKDSKSSPKNDFYTYINDRWIKNNDLFNIKLSKHQKYISKVDDVRLIQDMVYTELHNIILNYITKDNKISKCMKNFYESNKKLLSKNLAKKFYAGQEREYNGAFNYTPPVDILLIPDFPIEGKKTILNIEPLSNRERKEFESALEKLSLLKE